MLIWLSLLFNQKPLGTHMNDLSQKEKLRNILEILIFSEKNLTPHTYSPEALIWKSLWKYLLSCYKNDPTRTRLLQWMKAAGVTERGRIKAKPSQPFCFYNQGMLPGGLHGDQCYLLPDKIKKWGNSFAKASGTWKIIDCNSQSQIF